MLYRAAFACSRPSQYAGWVLADGRVVPARCGAPNKCAYCAYLATVENAVVVGLDAERYGHPAVGATLTTVDPETTGAAFRRDVEHALRALRRPWPELQYLGFVEWTTGKGVRSGGRRRIHMHLLLRNVSPSDAAEAEQLLRKVWLARTGASMVEARPLRSAAGATAYLVHHHRKREQAPPEGWSGKRLRPSRGYFGEPVADLRREAKLLAQDERVRRAANRLLDWEQLDGAPDEYVDDRWEGALQAAQREASLVTFVRFDRDGGIVPPRSLAS